MLTAILLAATVMTAKSQVEAILTESQANQPVLETRIGQADYRYCSRMMECHGYWLYSKTAEMPVGGMGDSFRPWLRQHTGRTEVPLCVLDVFYGKQQNGLNWKTRSWTWTGRRENCEAFAAELLARGNRR